MSRLEELLGDLPYTIRHSGELEPLKQFAREQDERVQELEKVEYAFQEIYRQEREYNKKLEQQNKRYREVIKMAINENGSVGDRRFMVNRILEEALKGESE